jgi:hypothetical protein
LFVKPTTLHVIMLPLGHKLRYNVLYKDWIERILLLVYIVCMLQLETEIILLHISKQKCVLYSSEGLGHLPMDRPALSLEGNLQNGCEFYLLAYNFLQSGES